MNTFIQRICFVLLVFVLAFEHSSAQTQLMTIKDDTVSIQLETATIKVQVVGNMATTSVELTFYNPLDRILEGELNFPLTEGQHVHRFALDVNGRMREAVVVDKAKGQRTFERIVRQNIDPGLLEMTAGNNYRARIYPIPAKGRRTVIVGYEEELSYNADGLYVLSMDYGLIQKLNLTIEVLNTSVEPVFKENDLANFSFKKWQNIFKAEHHAINFKSDRPVSFNIPHHSDHDTFYHTEKDITYFYTVLHPNTQSRPKPLPKSIALVWDVSLSAQKRNTEKELQMLETYLSRFEKVTVRLVKVSNVVVKNQEYVVRQGQWKELRDELESSVYDGGTNLGVIDFNQLKVDEAIVCSDGLSTLNKERPAPPSFPVYTISSTLSADYDWLRSMAERSNGAFINLLNVSAHEALQRLTTTPFRFISATYPKSITSTYPSEPVTVTGPFSFVGKVSTSGASVKLNFGFGQEITHTETIELSPDRKPHSAPAVMRMWAQKKIDALLQQERNEEAIQTATRYGIVTPYTSLIVLDRVEDYVQYEIIPPDELRAEYNRLIKEKKSRVSEDESTIIKRVLNDMEEDIDWWSNNRKDTKVEPARSQTNAQPERPADQTPAPPQQREDDAPSISEPVQQPAAPQEPRPSPQPPMLRPGFNHGVAGSITDESGYPMPGVNVLIKGTTIGTVTDVFGNYSLAVPDENATLVISFIGYTTIEVPVQDRIIVDVQMEPDVKHLSEVVVVGYAMQQERKSLSYSVVHVIEGRAPGVSINQHEQRVRIRGNASMEAESKPLYIVDGVPVSPEQAAAIQGEELSSINMIEPEQATAIYGSAAATGVVVIVTKEADEDGFELPDSITSRFKRDIQLVEWNPDEPYLDSIQAVDADERYTVYLRLREQYKSTPSFFLIMGNYFIQEGATQTGLRILTNLAEMELEDHELMKALAHRFIQLGEFTAAVRQFEAVKSLRPDEPHSYRDLALAYSYNGDFQKALDTFLQVLLMDGDDNDWDDRFPYIKNIILEEMNNLIQKHKSKLDLTKVPEEFIRPMPVDLRIVLDWNALETDIDLWVTEPNGEKCYYSNSLTVSGGFLSEDFTDGYGPEVYRIKEAVPGTYIIEVDFYDERTQKISGPVTLSATIFQYYGTPFQKEQSITVQLKNEEEDSLKIAEVVLKPLKK